jgi:hypothetical protein
MKIIDFDESVLNSLSLIKLHNAIDVLEYTKTIDLKPQICLCGEMIFKVLTIARPDSNGIWETAINVSIILGEEDKKILFMRAPDLKPNQILII